MTVTAALEYAPPSQLAWHRLQTLWEGDEQVVQLGLPGSQLTPAWQILLLGDGSPTRHLQLLTGEPTAVDVLEMTPVGHSEDGAPRAIAQVPGPRLRRQVWLRTATGQRLAYAVSWWNEAQVDAYLRDKSIPIWASLAEQRTELFRDVRGIQIGHSQALEEAFAAKGPFWSRHYLFWHHGRPLTLIQEVFSPVLDRWLGETQRQAPIPE
jgi:chorismate lyase